MPTFLLRKIFLSFGIKATCTCSVCNVQYQGTEDEGFWLPENLWSSKMFLWIRLCCLHICFHFFDHHSICNSTKQTYPCCIFRKSNQPCKNTIRILKRIAPGWNSVLRKSKWHRIFFISIIIRNDRTKSNYDNRLRKHSTYRPTTIFINLWTWRFTKKKKNCKIYVQTHAYLSLR